MYHTNISGSPTNLSAIQQLPFDTAMRDHFHLRLLLSFRSLMAVKQSLLLVSEVEFIFLTSTPHSPPHDPLWQSRITKRLQCSSILDAASL